MQPNDSELFRPTLQGQSQSLPAAGQRPWRLWSPFWIAFFGGVLPYTVVAYLNSRRLGMPEQRQRLILALGAVGLLVTIVVTYALTAWLGSDRANVVRLGSRIVAVLAFLAGFSLQKSADRRYSFATGGAYASLWVFGLAVTLVLGFVQNIAVYFIVRLLP
jgi:Na+/melibiose symporter-like transporter